MVDITPPSVIDVPAPKDAADNIAGANSFGIGPDQYAGIKDLLKPTLDATKTTNNVTPVVADYAAQSTQHLGLIKGDGPVIDRAASVNAETPFDVSSTDDPQKHSFTENYFNFIGGQLKHGIFGDQKTTDLTMEKITDGYFGNDKTWNDDKELQLQASKMDDQQNQPLTYGLTPNEQFAGHVLGNGAAMLSDAWNNKGVFSSLIGGGAGAGFLAGGPKGALKGATIGADAAFAYSTFRNATASTYNTLSDAKSVTDQPLNIDETTKKYTALGVGTINAAIQFGAGLVVAKNLPGVGSALAPNTIKAIMSDPAQQGLKKAIFSLGKSMSTFGGAASLQSAIQTFAISFAKNYDGTPEGVSNALASAMNDLKSASPDILRTGLEAAGTVGVAHVGLGAAKSAIGAIRGSEGSLPIANNSGTTPIDQLPKSEPRFPLDSPQAKALQVVNVGNAIDQINKVSVTTKMQEHAPLEMVTLQKAMADKAGIDKVYLDPQDLQTWGEKGGRDAAVRSWFGGKSLMNEPAAVPMHTFLGLAREFPDITDLVRTSPDGPSVAEARESLKNPEPEEEQKPIESSEKVLDPTEEIRKNNIEKGKVDASINDPNLKLVDQFKGVEGEQGHPMHEEPGHSSLAIDPRSLPDEQKHLAKDPQLKEHGIFVKGGMSADNAAALVGISDGETLLKTLKNTPTREQVANEVNRQQSQIQEQPEVKKTTQDYTAGTKAHLAEMQSLKKVETPAETGETVKIDLPVPSYGEVASEAKSTVGETKIKDLNADVHKVGERNSVQIAEEAKPEGELLKSFQARKAAARNSEMAKQSEIAINKVNKVVQLVSKFTPEIMENLKAKGKDFYNAANEILSKLNLDQEADAKTKEDSLSKLADKQTNNGGIFGPAVDPDSIPVSFKEMTVNQAIALGDTLKNIIKNADMKDQFYKAPEVDLEDKSYESVVSKAVQLAKEHPLYKPPGNEPVKSEQSRWYKMSRFFSDDSTQIKQEQHILADMDRGQVAGFWRQLIFKPKNDALFAEKQLRAETAVQNNKIIDEFGRKEFERLASDTVFVPEFNGTKIGDGYGNVTKQGLLALELNFGNEGNLKVMDEYGLDRKVIRDVLDRELTDKHVQLAQNFRNVFASFYDKAQELQRRTQGTEFTPVEAQPYQARGKEIPGGYYPIFRTGDEISAMSEKLVGTYELNKMKQNMSAQALTEQGHTITREGGQGTLDLDLGRYGHALNQLIHDLTYREAVADTGKILADPRIADAITGIAGKGGYDLMVNNLIDASGKVDREGYNRSLQWTQQAANWLGQGMRVMGVGLKLSSALRAFGALPQVFETMGKVNATKHFSLTLGKMLTRPDFMATGHVYDFAREIDPSIKNLVDDIAGKTGNDLVDMMPKKGSKLIDPLAMGKEFITRASMAAVGGTHQFIKVLTALASYSQAFSGDAKGVEANNHEAAIDYARGISERTQSHYEPDYLSNLQKNKNLAPFVTYFFNDANNSNNNTILVARLAKAKFAESGNAYDKGQYGIAAKAAAQGTGGIMSHAMTVIAARALYMSLVTAGSAAIISKFTGSESREDEDYDNFGVHLLKQSVEETIGTIPIARDALHSTMMQPGKHKGYTFQTPFLKMGNDFLTASVGLTHALKLFSENDVTPEEAKAMVYSLGYLTRTPVDALYRYMGSPDLTDSQNLPTVRTSDIARMVNAITGFVAKNEEKPPAQQFSPEVIAQLNALKTKYDVETPKPIPAGAIATAGLKQKASNIPSDYYEIVAEAESRNNPNAVSKSSTKASGLAQIVQGTWNGIRENHPELGLDEMTERGQIMPIDQQRKAFAALTIDNAKALTKANVPVNNNNLYILHVLGLNYNRGIAAISAPDNMKMRNIPGLGSSVIRENPQLFKQKQSTTVAQFKVNISKFLDKAEDRALDKEL